MASHHPGSLGIPAPEDAVGTPIDSPVTGLPSSLERLRSRVDPITNINFKVINHIDSRPAIRQLTARDLTDVEVHECYEGPCTVDIRPTATAPLYRLPVRAFGAGYYWRTDFRLVGGRILHDYLADPTTPRNQQADRRLGR